MSISEVYYTLQGEGILIGLPSVIVRFSGCNLQCTWCDTPKKKPDPNITYDDIRKVLETNKCNHLIFTGGEPTLYQQTIKEILVYLKCKIPYPMHYTIETNATTRIAPFLLSCPMHIMYSLSPKLSSSGNRYSKQDLIRMFTDLTDNWSAFQLKLCIDMSNLDDLTDTKHILDILNATIPDGKRRPDVILQPVSRPLNASHYVNLYEYSQNLNRLYVWAKEDLNTVTNRIRILPQLHKIIWGFKTEGV